MPQAELRESIQIIEPQLMTTVAQLVAPRIAHAIDGAFHAAPYLQRGHHVASGFLGGFFDRAAAAEGTRRGTLRGLFARDEGVIGVVVFPLAVATGENDVVLCEPVADDGYVLLADV